MLTLEQFNRRFRIVKTSLLEFPEDLSQMPGNAPLEGDCQTYARTVRNILRVKPWEAVQWRCKSPQNKWWWPRHAVLWVKGRGWIDSTRREFRNSPDSHTRLWPVGTPAIVWLIYTFGVFKGWWPLVVINPLGWINYL